MFFSLGPVPWALTAGEDALRKTEKAALANEIEKLAIATDCITMPTAYIMDEIIQKHKGNLMTFQRLQILYCESSRMKQVSAEELMQVLVIMKMNLLKMLSEVLEVLLKLRNSRTSFEYKTLSSGKNFSRDQIIKSVYYNFCVKRGRKQPTEENLKGKKCFNP